MNAHQIKHLKKVAFIICSLLLSCDSPKQQQHLIVNPVNQNRQNTNAIQQKADSTDKKTVISKSKFVDKKIYLGFAYGSINDSTEIKPDTSQISKSAFLKYKNADTILKIIHDLSKISGEKSSFIIKTAKGNTKYHLDSIWKESGAPIEWQSYVGFFGPLKLYIIKDKSNGEFEFSKVHLIDSLTNITYELESNHDGSSSIPIFSPNQKSMAFFSEEMDDPESLINIIKITKGFQSNIYKNFTAIKTKWWLIKDLVWIDDNSLAIKAEKANNSNLLDRPKQYVYFKYIIHKSPLIH